MAKKIVRRGGWGRAVGGLAVAALLAGLLGCGEEAENPSGACSASTSIDRSAALAVRDSAGSAAVGQYDFDVSALGVGAVKEFSFQIANTAAAVAALPLRVKSAQIQEFDNAGQPIAASQFACVGPGDKPCDQAKWPEVVPAGFDPACAEAGAVNSAAFKVRYSRPAAPAVRSAQLTLVFEGDVKQGATPVVLKFGARLGSPKLSCNPPGYDFGKVNLADAASTTVVCANTGKAEAVITQAKMLGSLPLLAKLGGHVVQAAAALPEGTQVVVPAGSTLPINVWFEKLPNEQKMEAILRLGTNDPTKPQVDLSFTVNATGPCLSATPASLDFGEQPPGVQVKKEVQIKSCGTEDLKISSVVIGGAAEQGFGVSLATTCFDGKAPTADAPLLIPKGESCSLFVTYTAPQLGAVSVGSLEIDSSAGKKSVALQGAGAASVACPKACMSLQIKGGGPIKGAVVPQTEVQLDASCSTPANQPIAKWKWSVQQPAGSYSVLAPSDAAKAPTFQPNIAGKYTFSLEIADEIGTPGCAAANYELMVIPDDKLHVELTWDTAADGNKTDVGDKDGKLTDGKYAGSDMDLHLAHPDALDQPGQADLDKDGSPEPWNATCYDCFVLNTLPQWGDLSDYDDDATLDRDDKDGWGPENINLFLPEPAVQYFVGVYYWSANGFGKSTPTVRIYLDGQSSPFVVKTGPLMAQGELWCAGRVSWKPSAVIPCKNADAQGNLLHKAVPLPSPAALKCK